MFLIPILYLDIYPPTPRRFPEAQEQLTSALAIAPPDSLEAAALLSTLGACLQAQDDIRGALAKYEEALAIRGQLLKPKDALLAASHNECGGILRLLGKYTQALEHFNAALPTLERIDPNSHSTAMCHSYLGDCHRKVLSSPDYSKALDHLRQALSIFLQLSDQDRYVAMCHSSLGLTLHSMNKCEEAVTEFKAALDLWLQPGGAGGEGVDHVDLAVLYQTMGQCYLSMQPPKPVEARECYLQCQAIREKILPAGSPKRLAIQKSINAIE